METIANSYQLLNMPGDPVTKDLFFISANSCTILIYSFIYLYFVFKLGPQYMANRKPYDLRPYMLIYNGLVFGPVVHALILFGWMLKMGLIGWSCQEPTFPDFSYKVMVYSGYGYFWFKIYTSISTVFMVLRKKERQNPKIHALNNCAHIILSYFGMKFYPKTLFATVLYGDGIIILLRCIYYIYTSTGSNFLINKTKYKRTIYQLECFGAALLSTQYFQK